MLYLEHNPTGWRSVNLQTRRIAWATLQASSQHALDERQFEISFQTPEQIAKIRAARLEAARIRADVERSLEHGEADQQP